MRAIEAILFCTFIFGSSAITRKEVLTRAQFWFSHKVNYSQSQFFPDPNGRHYRTDCSGFTSMVWKLPTSLSTVTIPMVSKPITKEQLLPGDAMCRCGGGMQGKNGHVLIFEKWTNGNKTDYWAFDQNGPTGSPIKHWIVPWPYRNGGERYGAWRYDKIK